MTPARPTTYGAIGLDTTFFVQAQNRLQNIKILELQTKLIAGTQKTMRI